MTALSVSIPRRLMGACLLLLAGCNLMPTHPVAVDPHARPAWIDEPGDGASASAGFHVMGRQAQEELAVTRAREELAKRQGVTVSSEHEVAQRVTADRSSSTAAKVIREELKDKEVRAVVKSKWTDPQSGVLWVWVVLSK